MNGKFFFEDSDGYAVFFNDMQENLIKLYYPCTRKEHYLISLWTWVDPDGLVWTLMKI